MDLKLEIDSIAGEDEFGLLCRRLVPWPRGTGETPFGLMKCTLPPGGASAPDRHAQDEIAVFLAGSASVRVGEATVPAVAGEMVLIPSGEEHVVRNEGEAALEWLALYWPLHEEEAQ